MSGGPSTHNEASRTPRAVVFQRTWLLNPSGQPKIPSVVTVTHVQASHCTIMMGTQRTFQARRTTSSQSFVDNTDDGCHSHVWPADRCHLPMVNVQANSIRTRTAACCHSSSGMISDVSPTRYGISLSSQAMSGQGNAASRFSMLIRSAMQALHTACPHNAVASLALFADPEREAR